MSCGFVYGFWVLVVLVNYVVFVDGCGRVLVGCCFDCNVWEGLGVCVCLWFWCLYLVSDGFCLLDLDSWFCGGRIYLGRVEVFGIKFWVWGLVGLK